MTITGLCNCAVSGEDIIEVKPDKKPFLRITELLGVPPNKCIYIGDKQDVDVVGAKKIGMKTIIIGDDIIKENNDLLPDYFIKRRDLKGLYKLILSLLN